MVALGHRMAAQRGWAYVESLIVKSTQHFYGRFAPIASEVIYAAAPGTVAPVFKAIPYQVANRHRYPMVEDPLGTPVS